MKYLTFLFLLMFVFVSLFVVSIPQMLYGHSGGGSHLHPHDPEKTVCTGCAELVTPGSHYCVKDQEKDVKISNANANVKRLEEKVDKDKDKGWLEYAWDTTKSFLEPVEKLVFDTMEFISQKEGSVQCQGCENWVPKEDELDHWGTGNCAVGHEHWTCKESERKLHAGCHWVNKPETNPDSMYEGSKYS